MHAPRWLTGGILTLTFLGICSLGNAAYGKKKAAEETAAPAVVEAVTDKAAQDQETEMMAKMQQAATPGEGHRALDVLVGSWDHEVKWWKAPDAPPEVSTGTSDSQWVLGGRFVEQKVTGTMMGQPFEGKGTIGYDNVKKEYVSTWMDNMSTGIMSGTAQYDPATKTFTEKGSFTCPIKDGPMSFRTVHKIVDDDTYVSEMFMEGPDGKEAKSMEITYKRKK